MTNLRLPLVLGAVLLIAGCASQEESLGSGESLASGRSKQCFFPSEITGYTDAGDDRLHVHTGPSEVYLFETFGSCRDLNWSETIGIDQAGSGTICSGLDVTLVVPTPIGPRRCPVRMIRRLSEAEARAR